MIKKKGLTNDIGVSKKAAKMFMTKRPVRPRTSRTDDNNRSQSEESLMMLTIEWLIP